MLTEHPLQLQTRSRLPAQTLAADLLCCLSMISVLVALTGCMTPENTRFPSFYRPHPLAERAAYERSDPLYDPDIGPSLNARPREFRQPRTIERRAAQNRLLRGRSLEPEATPPFPAGQSYPGVVR